MNEEHLTPFLVTIGTERLLRCVSDERRRQIIEDGGSVLESHYATCPARRSR